MFGNPFEVKRPSLLCCKCSECDHNHTYDKDNKIMRKCCFECLLTKDNKDKVCTKVGCLSCRYYFPEDEDMRCRQCHSHICSISEYDVNIKDILNYYKYKNTHVKCLGFIDYVKTRRNNPATLDAISSNNYRTPLVCKLCTKCDHHKDTQYIEDNKIVKKCCFVCMMTEDPYKYKCEYGDRCSDICGLFTRYEISCISCHQFICSDKEYDTYLPKFLGEDMYEIHKCKASRQRDYMCYEEDEYDNKIDDFAILKLRFLRDTGITLRDYLEGIGETIVGFDKDELERVMMRRYAHDDY